ncbi:MAG: hypothetical protein FWC58_00570 [Desulfobulbus sp.]|nr:hypothetical protein [Desulfobulbus sp.]
MGRGRSILILAVAALLAAGCVQTPVRVSDEPVGREPVIEEHEAVPLLAYYQSLARLNASELAKERSALAILPAGPAKDIRLAMVAGHPRGQADVAKALAQVESVLRSNEPAAVQLRPLARLLADQYGERLRLDNERLRLEGALERQEELFERQGVLLKESQRKAQELQEKLNGLADIERTLPPRPRAGQGPQGGQR